MEEYILEKAKRIKLLILDVDGVLTDGRIIYDSKGRDSRFFNVNDGLGVYLLKKGGILTVLVTAKGTPALEPRARDMQVVEVISTELGSKASVLAGLLKKYKVSADEVCFVGDDLVDLSLMKLVGFAIAVFNACPEIKGSAHYITRREGGRGAVREVAELILKSQDKWQEMLRLYQS